MPREIDDKKTRKALRRLQRAKKAADDATDENVQLSDWEDEFLGSLEERLDAFGSAFNDPEKGNLDDALSARQSVKLREIEKKAKGKGRKPISRGQGFKRKTAQRQSTTRDINEDLDEAASPESQASTPPPQTPAPLASKPAGFKPVIIEGGKLKS